MNNVDTAKSAIQDMVVDPESLKFVIRGKGIIVTRD